MISRSKAQEAKLQLRHVLMLEKNYFYINSKYTTDLKEIGFEQAKLTTNEGNANYLIEITSASSKDFTSKATSIVDFQIVHLIQMLLVAIIMNFLDTMQMEILKH